MKKKIILLASLLATTCLCSCGGGNEVAGSDGQTYAKKIIVYTNQTSGGRGSQLEAMIAKENFPFSVTLVELAGQNLKNRLINEKNNPFADVVLGGSTAEYIQLKEEQVITPYEPVWKANIDEKYYEAENYYTPWAVEPLYLCYNTKYFTNNPSKVTSTVSLAPTGWGDLADNFKGKYNVFKPSSTSGTIIYSSILCKYRDPNGHLGISQEGWDFLGKVINNGILDNGLWQANLAGNKSPIAMSWAGAVLEVEDAYEVDLDVVVPEEGVPATISQIALTNVKNEGRLNAGKMFIDWWGKEETQIEWAKISCQAPLNKAAIDKVDPKVREIADVKIMDLDWEFIAKYSSQWREYIELNVLD